MERIDARYGKPYAFRVHKRRTGEKRRKDKCLFMAKTCNSPYWVKEEDFVNGVLKPLDEPYLTCSYRGKRSAYLKRVCNRKVRRTAKNLSVYNNGAYKKVKDFWWLLD